MFSFTHKKSPTKGAALKLLPSWLVVAPPERDVHFFSSAPATDTFTLASISALCQHWLYVIELELYFREIKARTPLKAVGDLLLHFSNERVGGFNRMNRVILSDEVVQKAGK